MIQHTGGEALFVCCRSNGSRTFCAIWPEEFKQNWTFCIGLDSLTMIDPVCCITLVTLGKMYVNFVHG
jgi:hypothetical protein